MKTYILKENVLTDDVLYLPEENKIFKGSYIAIIEIFTFLNSWSDKKMVKKFRSEKRLNKFLLKNYPNFYNDEVNKEEY